MLDKLHELQLAQMSNQLGNGTAAPKAHVAHGLRLAEATATADAKHSDPTDASKKVFSRSREASGSHGHQASLDAARTAAASRSASETQLRGGAGFAQRSTSRKERLATRRPKRQVETET